MNINQIIMSENDEQPLSPFGRPIGQPRQLYRSSLSEIPPGAIILSRSEVNELMYRKIQNHPNKLEIWPLTGYKYITGAAGSLSGLIFTKHYRRFFKLANVSVVSTYGTVAVVGWAMPLILHRILINHEILEGYYGCRICLGIRSGVLQTLGGGIYPWVVSGIACLFAARENYTFKFQGSAVLKAVHKGNMNTLGLTSFVVLGLNFLLGMYMCEREMECFDDIMDKTLNPQNSKLTSDI